MKGDLMQLNDAELNNTNFGDETKMTLETIAMRTLFCKKGYFILNSSE